MAKHDYTAANISNISSEITAMKNVTNSELSIESMQYDWYNTIFTLAEIQMVCNEKNRLSKFFEQANNKLSEKSENIQFFDNNIGSQIEKTLNTLNSINSSILNLTNQAVEYGVVQENKAWIRAIKIEINSEEIKRLMDLDVNKLTDEDKRRIQVILKHLSKEININNMTDEIKEKISQFNALYEKLYPEQAKEIKESLLEKAYMTNKKYDKCKIESLKYLMFKGFSFEEAEYRYENQVFYISTLIDIPCSDELGFKQGSFEVTNINAKKEDDGSVYISFVARQYSLYSSYGAVIVYNYNNEIEKIVVLDRHHNMTSMVDWLKQHYRDYSETNVNVKIPKDGYIQITDDPNIIDIIQKGKIVDESINSKINDEIKKGVTEYIKETIGWDNIGKHATDKAKFGKDVFKKANAYWNFAKKAAEVVDNIEEVVYTEWQRGSNSTIIYNR